MRRYEGRRGVYPRGKARSKNCPEKGLPGGKKKKPAGNQEPLAKGSLVPVKESDKRKGKKGMTRGKEGEKARSGQVEKRGCGEKS